MSHLSSPSGLRFHILQALRVGFVAGLVGGCAPSTGDPHDGDRRADDESALSTRTRYVAIEDRLPPAAQAEWTGIKKRLFEQFDGICGDTFCEGDWSNLEPLDLACSATTALDRVRECVWTFAASEEQVEPAGASIPIFVCRFRPRAKAHELLVALRDDPLYAEVPGLGSSIYDLLGDCFESPTGATPLGDDDGLDGPYIDVRQGLDDETVEAWYDMTSALRTAYAEEVDGEPGTPRPLRVICSQDENTRAIGGCTWSFAGAEPRRRADGLHRIVPGRHLCTFTPDATPLELANALAATADAGPLDRFVPGVDLTMREILDGCL